MTLTQLRYIIEIVRRGSISTAAKALFITQPSLSKSVTELEKEMGITIFRRTNRGVVLSEEGVKFLSYARQVVEQADLLEHRYKDSSAIHHTFSISSQHYAIVVAAFVALVKEENAPEYDYYLREAKTYEVINDVHRQKSSLGILYESSFNHDVLKRILHDNDLDFIPLFTVKPHVFLRRNHPLASRDIITLEDLVPYPRLVYDQGEVNSFYFTEEVHSTEESSKNITVTDRGTIFNLMVGLDGYTISSGIMTDDFSGKEIVSIPLKSDEHMTLGAIKPKGMELTPLAERFLFHMKSKYRAGNNTDAVPSSPFASESKPAENIEETEKSPLEGDAQ